jgi:hypothetical protein
MNKKLLFLMSGCLTLMYSALFAQPILTATGTNPVIGESFTMNVSPYVNPGNSGTNQTWDLSSMSGTGGLTTVVTPASTTNGASFPASNIAWSNSSNPYISYFKTSSTALQNYGTFSSTIMSYSNPEDMLHFPFSYTNTFSDTWATQFVSGGYTFYRKGTTTVTADGYGTLITPSTSYTNVMRVHFVQVYQDSSFTGTPYIITYNNNEYMWYKEGAHVQIATVYTLTSSAGGPYTGATYVSGDVGINNLTDIISAFNLFPNPTSDFINIETQQKSEIEILNIAGQLIKSITANENTTSMDISDFAKGMYFVKVKTEKGIAVKKFIKE